MYLLDTNVVSELRKARAGKADRHVAAWAGYAWLVDPNGDLWVAVRAQAV